MRKLISVLAATFGVTACLGVGSCICSADDSTCFTMPDGQNYSSTDMQSITNFGTVLSDDNTSGGYLFHNTFESSTESWSGRGASTVSTSSTSSYSGSQSLQVKGRTASWNGASISFSAATFVPGSTYSFSAVVSQTTDTSTTFYMKLQYVDSNGDTNYSAIAQASTVKGEWVQLANTEYTIPADADEMSLYIETAEGTSDFYVDEVFGAPQGTAIEGPSEKIFSYGDINMDGTINIIDIILAKSGLIEGYSSDMAKLAANANRDSSTDVVDVKLILDYVIGNIDQFPKPTNIWDTYTETATPQMQKFYSDSIYQMGNTSRLREKIEKAQDGKKVTVAYLGGSITEGNGLETCYAKRSYNYFAQTFGTGSNVSYVNAGLSGTSSVVGLMRAQNDIYKYEPDVIFLEFSVNDHPEEIYKKSYESLVKQCLSQSNDPAVIILINRAKGGYSMQEQMAAIGKNYNVPVISMDMALTNAFNSGLLKTSDYYTDEYHPHANGCALISDCISYFYRQAMKTENITGEYTIPSSTVYGSEYSTASMANLSDLQNFNTGSFKTDNSNSRFQYGFTFQKNSANTPMTFTTQGKGIFITFKSNQNSSLGKLQITVNGVTSTIDGNKLYAWGGPDADLAYIQNTSGKLDVSIKMQNPSTDFTIFGIGVIK